MAALNRPGGVDIHWDERGEGPLVVFSMQFFGYPLVFEALIRDLAADHRVVLYDARGTGASTRRGPYDMETDAADLAAVVEAAGESALVIGMGDGCNRAVHVSADRPDLVSAVFTPGGNPVGRAAAEGTDSMVSSPAVLAGLAGMMETDYRGGLRTLIASANPQMNEDQARERVSRVVAYCAHDAAVARLRAWIDDEALGVSRAMGDRLWILTLEASNPWFPADEMERTMALLPEAHVEPVTDGPVSRPDLAAAVVRKITSLVAERAGSVSERGH
jgi:pimeloyl-ACP methyl ester carboxylesterase